MPVWRQGPDRERERCVPRVRNADRGIEKGARRVIMVNRMRYFIVPLHTMLACMTFTGCHQPAPDAAGRSSRDASPVAPIVTCLEEVSRTDSSFTVRFLVRNVLPVPILFLWTEPVTVKNKEDPEGRLMTAAYSQSLRWYGKGVYSNPQLWIRELAPGEEMTFTSTYGLKRLMPPLVTEFAFAKGLTPRARDHILSFDGTETYGRHKEWMVSVTVVIYVTCPEEL